ncbi:MAG: protein kinase domain-containing protein [Gemmatimonadaceae bacterium]
MTVPLDAPAIAMSSDEIATLRHDLRTPVNLIVGFCEMMLEDAADTPASGMEQPLGEALTAVHGAMSAIDRELPAGGGGVTPRNLKALHADLTAAREVISRAAETLRSAPVVMSQPRALDDVDKIASAAQRLVETARTALRGVEEVASARPGADSADSADSAAAPSASDKGRILVADDMEDNRALLERRLTREGFQVHAVAGGVAALELLARESFDLLLLDVTMPDLDGREVLRRMKADPAMRDVPVIMVSARDDMDTVVGCIEEGAEDYLPKPCNPVLLRARIKASIDKGRRRAEEARYAADVRVLTDAATAVAEGRFDASSLTRVALRGDELGQLARVLSAAITGTKAREDRLGAQLNALRSEIASAAALPSQPTEAENLPSLTKGDVVLDRFEIEELLGIGGMGVVYRARDRELGEPVALKMLRPDLLSNHESVERFKTEIRLARRISHRNVVRTHDLGEFGGRYFVTMELVEGVTLRDLIDGKGALDEAACISIGTQLARALQVAHAEGILHRDIKPQNVLLDPTGTAKVMDFGIARLADGTAALTQTGVVLGTPAYMAPEQLLGEPLDARADLYSLGVVMYESLTARTPFSTVSPVALIAQMLHHDPPAPIELRPSLGVSISNLVVSLLARDPANRPAKAAAVADELDRIV